MKLEDITNIEQYRCEDGKFRYIYKITNESTGEYYYGKHKTSDINDGYMSSSKVLKKYYELSGYSNITKSYECFVNTDKELNIAESKYIGNLWETDNHCLNLMPGGNGGFDYINKTYTSDQRSINKKKEYENKSDEYKKKYSDNVKNIMEEWKASLTEEEFSKYKQNITDGLKEFNRLHPGFWAGERNPFFGKTHTDESKKKISRSQTGVLNSQYGTMWICNDVTKESKKILKTDSIPDGWRKGKIQEPNTPEQIQKQREKQIGYKWITNGFENRQIRLTDTMPIGFHYGKRHTKHIL